MENLANLADRIPEDFLSYSREDQERILMEQAEMDGGQARFWGAMLRGEISGDATIDTPREKGDDNREIRQDRSA